MEKRTKIPLKFLARSSYKASYINFEKGYSLNLGPFKDYSIVHGVK
jgi:hypothetical protein